MTKSWEELEDENAGLYGTRPRCKDCGFTSGHDPLCRQYVPSKVDAAVLAERERCARIIMDLMHYAVAPEAQSVLYAAAARIRRGEP